MSTASFFLSTVSAEFASYRDVLRCHLTQPRLSVAIQEDFVATGTETLDKLDDYLRACDGVIHLIGDMTGALAQAPSVAVLQVRYPDFGARFPVLLPFLAEGGPALSYTQWEAWLALYHRKRLLICAPQDGTPRDARFVTDAAQRQAQAEHLQRLASVERFTEFRFGNAQALAIEVLRSPLGELVRGVAVAPRHLPRQPNRFFTGRTGLMQRVAEALGPPPRQPGAPLHTCVLHGLGGVGKTRLALEHAWAHTTEHSALLFADASEPGALERTLASFTAPAVLNLPEHAATEQSVRLAAVQRWLAQHPGWLLLADNVDSEAAAQALDDALAPLTGGQVLATSRLSRERWGSAWHRLEVQALAPADAAAFVLERTQGLRRTAPDDAAQAARLAAELGHLPLALEQAAAYVAQRRLTLAAYLQKWADSRDRLLGWFDARVMGYPRSVAVTWQTSVQQLSAPALRLLQRLAWLAPEPLPETLLDVRVGADDPLAELATFSLAQRDETLPQFSVHRLVQQVTRTGLGAESRPVVLGEALAWMDAAFVGDAQDVRYWPVLEPLVPHAQEVMATADQAGQMGLKGRLAKLMNKVAVLLNAKAMYSAAEPLMHRVLVIDEASFGPDHPKVATHLNNLAQLLLATNRLAEADPLMHRALTIDEASFGPDHSKAAIRLNNLGLLLKATDRPVEAELMIRRALVIAEASFGPDHLKVAMCLNNLASLLYATNRLAEAEPMMRRALTIDEASFEPDYPHVAICLNNLAQLLRATNRLAEAEPMMRRALAIDEASFGPEHPDVARDLNNLAQFFQDTNRLPESVLLMCRAFGVMARSLGLDHPKTQIVWSNYFVLASELGHTREIIIQTLRAELGDSPAPLKPLASASP